MAGIAPAVIRGIAAVSKGGFAAVQPPTAAKQAVFTTIFPRWLSAHGAWGAQRPGKAEEGSGF
jgi:hypothetical protein